MFEKRQGTRSLCLLRFLLFKFLNAVCRTMMVWRAAVFLCINPLLPLLPSLPSVQIRFLLVSVSLYYCQRESCFFARKFFRRYAPTPARRYSGPIWLWLRCAMFSAISLLEIRLRFFVCGPPCAISQTTEGYQEFQQEETETTEERFSVVSIISCSSFFSELPGGNPR